MTMRRNVALMAACLVALGLGCAAVMGDERLPEGTPTPAPAGDGWINLFADSGAWENATDAAPVSDIFALEDGVFHIAGASTHRYLAYTPQTFGDFELHLEFKVSPGANSGLFVRTNPQDPVQGGMEIQVLDSYGQPPNKQACGSLYDVASPMFQMVRPAGEWNSYDIRFEGDELEVSLNGWRVLCIDLSLMTMPIGKFDTPLAQLPKSGHIVLQDHGGEVWYRNLLVRPL